MERAQEPMLTEEEQTTSSGTQSRTSAASEQARAVASSASWDAKEMAHEAQGQMRQVAEEARNELRTLADQGRDQLRGQAQAQTHRASQNLRMLGERTRALAEGRPDEAGPLKGYAEDLSERLSGWADRLDQRGFDGVVSDVQRFARRRPIAFIGACALAGFAVTRVARTARSNGSQPQTETRPRRLESTAAGSLPGTTTPPSAYGSEASERSIEER